ncbi:hypothetical protein XENOCAPTIV_008136 [Xenoophorus captivus]|uniref:Uncharacterized protein n=1 Tax=Xenoophorus captivus TaxID=1517983 RepID=A0ABV0R0F8_9TELE
MLQLHTYERLSFLQETPPVDQHHTSLQLLPPSFCNRTRETNCRTISLFTLRGTRHNSCRTRSLSKTQSRKHNYETSEHLLELQNHLIVSHCELRLQKHPD